MKAKKASLGYMLLAQVCMGCGKDLDEAMGCLHGLKLIQEDIKSGGGQVQDKSLKKWRKIDKEAWSKKEALHGKESNIEWTLGAT